MRAILRLDTKTQHARIEGRYRTIDHMHRSWRRLRGDNPSEWIAFLTGDALKVSDPRIRAGGDRDTLAETLTLCGALVITPEEDTKNLDSLTVFVPGDLDSFLRKLGTYPHLIVDDLEGPLPLRDHVDRTGGNLPLGKYEATKRREEGKLMLKGILDSETFEDAVSRAREVIGQRRDLLEDAQVMLRKWRAQ